MARKYRNQIFEQVTIGPIAEAGRCIARIADQVLFVAHVAPGDVVDLQITGRKKGVLHATPVHIHQPSPSRVEPFCQHFGTCGGCHWQHVSYPAQLQAKEQLVREKLTRIGQLTDPPIAPIIGAADTTYYRNKLEFTFSNQRWLSTEEIQSNQVLDRRALGFHRPGCFDKLVDIQHCHLQPDPSNAIRQSVAAFARAHNLSFYDFKTHQGLLRNLIIRTTATGEVMVIVQFGQPDEAAIESVMQHLDTQFPTLTSLQYIVNTKHNETFYDLPVHCYRGQPYITEVLCGLQFRIGAKSFFQTNTAQAQVLYNKIKELAALQRHELLYDLYTGVGSIALYLAQYVQHVVGVDTVPGAIADAVVNASLNQVTNASFVAGEVEHLVDNEFVATYGQPDVVVVDPPRAGLHARVVTQLLRMAPARIIYVSCNPATQARDIALLQPEYQLTTAQPVDLFPHTSHVENIAVLVRKP